MQMFHPLMVLEAVSRNDLLLAALLPEHRADHKVVLEAVNIVMLAVREDGLELEFASHELRADREVVLAALSVTGCALQFASEVLRADRSVVHAAVNRDGAGLRFTTPTLQMDTELVRLSKQRRRNW